MKTKTFPVCLAVLCLALWRLPAAGDTAGHCFVAESGTGIIYDYATNGTRTVYATNTGRPYGLAFDKAGNLFVANFDGGIYKISPDGSNSVFADLYNGPAGLAFDNSGNLFVGVYGNGYIFEYAPDGTRSIFGQEPSFDAYNYGRPVGLAFSPSGVLYATDEFFGYLYRGVPDYSPFASVPGDPWGLAFDSRSNLFVADSSAGKIYKFVSIGGIPGSSYTTFATNMSQPTGLAFDSNDNLFVADYSAGKVYKIDTNGVRTTFASGLSAPVAVAFSPVTQSAGLPPLVISRTGNSVLVLWKNSGTCTLQQNGNLTNPNGWTTSGDTITTANGTNSITISPPAGNLFFRLSQP
jgi:glucose/arabinose dehydrogenase